MVRMSTWGLYFLSSNQGLATTREACCISCETQLHHEALVPRVLPILSLNPALGHLPGPRQLTLGQITQKFGEPTMHRSKAAHKGRLCSGNAAETGLLIGPEALPESRGLGLGSGIFPSWRFPRGVLRSVLRGVLRGGGVPLLNPARTRAQLRIFTISGALADQAAKAAGCALKLRSGLGLGGPLVFPTRVVREGQVGFAPPLAPELHVGHVVPRHPLGPLVLRARVRKARNRRAQAKRRALPWVTPDGTPGRPAHPGEVRRPCIALVGRTRNVARIRNVPPPHPL